MRRFFVALLLFIISAIGFISTNGVANPAIAAVKNNEYKVETIGTLTEAKVAEAIRQSLDEKGLRVADDKGKTVCEVWFRKDIPVTKNEIPGANFGQIPEGTLIGVINFPANVIDFRGQGVKAGFYTLRFGLILQDGNHLGVSPARDFVLLCPVADDKNTSQLKMDDVVKLSRTASGTSHPTVWCMVQPSSEKDLPKVSQNEHEHVILETKLSTSTGALPIGLIVIGRTEG